MFKKCVLFVCFMVMVPRVFAQALPVPVTPMQNAISGVIQQKMIQRGFAANDPRFGATLAMSSTALAGVAGTTAAAVTAGAITAPAWVTVAIAAGIGAVVTYAVTIGIDALANWLFRSDGNIDESVDGVSPFTVPGTVVGQIVWCTNQGAGGNCASTFDASARQAAQELVTPQSVYSSFVSVSCSTTSSSSVSCTPHFLLRSNGSTVNGPLLYVNLRNAITACPTGQFYRSGSCFPFTWPATSINATSVSPQTAINDLPAADKDKALNPVVVAAVADQAWRSAAALPGYDGLPYQASDPITQADAARWQASNPSSWPTVSNFVDPQATPSGGTSASPWVLPNTVSPVPSYSPTTSPQQTTSTNPSTQPLSNLGPDPGIGQPTLEATPTAQEILQPILSLFPDLRSYVVPSHSGVCPKPSMDLWGKQLVLDGHCNLLDNNRAAIQAVMAMVWVMVALFIILAA